MCITLLPTYLCGTQFNKIGCFLFFFSALIPHGVEERLLLVASKPWTWGIIPIEQSSPSKATFAFLYLNVAKVPAVDPRFWDVSW